MLHITPLKDAAAAAEYFAKEDYYLADEGGGPPRFVYGEGSRAIGLTTDFDEERLKELFDGNFSDEYKAEKVGNKSRRVGYDFTFSAPKSVSIEGLVFERKEFRDAHAQAVRETMELFERELLAVRTTLGGETTQHRPGSGLIAVGVEHHTSREKDPQLHTHVLVMNAVHPGEGGLLGERLRAIDPNAFVPTGATVGESDIAPILGRMYQANLARQMKKLGYDIRELPGKGMFELAHFKEEHLTSFSTRRQQVLEAVESADGQRLRRAGLNEVQIAQAMALQTRKAKDTDNGVDRETLHLCWNEAAKERGIKRGVPKTLVAREASFDSTPKRQRALDRELASGILSLSERTSVFEEGHLYKYVLNRSMGRFTFPEIRQRLDELKAGAELSIEDERLKRLIKSQVVQLISADGTLFRQELSTQHLSELDRQIIATLREPRGVPRLASREEVRAHSNFESLSESQQLSLLHISTTQKAVVGIQGYAGTGKSTMLKTFRELCEERGETCAAFAPSHQALRGLTDKGFEGITVQRLLKGGLKALGKTSLRDAKRWVIDEASMLSARDMTRLLSLAKAAKAQVILVGDKEQLAAIDAGSPFALMQRYGMQTSAIEHVFRQNEAEQSIKDAVADAMKVGSNRAAQMLMKADKVTEIPPDKTTMFREMARTYVEELSKGEAPMVLYPTHKSRGLFHEELRPMLVESGKLGDILTTYDALEAKPKTSIEQKDIRTFEVGDVLIPVNKRGWIDPRINESSRLEVVSVDHKSGHVELLVTPEFGAKESDPFVIRHDVKTLPNHQNYLRGERQVRIGEVMRTGEVLTTVGSASRPLPKNSVLTILGNGIKAGTLDVRVGDEEHVIKMTDLPKLTYGYSATNHAMQGASKQNVLVGVSRSDRQMVTHESFYVAITRTEKELEVFTDNADELQQWTLKSGQQQNAIEFDKRTQSADNLAPYAHLLRHSEHLPYRHRLDFKSAPLPRAAHFIDQNFSTIEAYNLERSLPLAQDALKDIRGKLTLEDPRNWSDYHKAVLFKETRASLVLLDKVDDVGEIARKVHQLDKDFIEAIERFELDRNDPEAAKQLTEKTTDILRELDINIGQFTSKGDLSARRMTFKEAHTMIDELRMKLSLREPLGPEKQSQLAHLSRHFLPKAAQERMMHQSYQVQEARAKLSKTLAGEGIDEVRVLRREEATKPSLSDKAKLQLERYEYEDAKFKEDAKKELNAIKRSLEREEERIKGPQLKL